MEKQPRKKVTDFEKMEDPPVAEFWTFDQVQEGDGKDGNPFYCALNGNVLELQSQEEYLLKEMLSLAEKEILGKGDYDI